MFEDIGAKIKGLATFLCWVGIITSIAYAIVLWSQNSYHNSTVGMGALVLFAGTIISWIGSWILYAFGQITEDIHAMAPHKENE